MTARDRTIPTELPAFADAHHPRNGHTSFRVIVDASALFSIAGLLFGGGVAWKTFLDDGKRLDQNDALIQQVIQIEQAQQTTSATLAQAVKDLQDQRDRGSR